MFALVDCNNFYVSCERLFRPDLNGKPVVVLSNNDGCVISRSNEAKALGIPMGAAAFEYDVLFRKHDVRVFSSNYALYGDMSNRIMQMLAAACPETEVYSIDEAFMLFGASPPSDCQAFGNTLRERILRATGIPVSIGFAGSRALSKLANRIAKTFAGKTANVYAIDSDIKREKALRWLCVRDIWGVGKQHAERLQAIGVTNAFQFTQLSDQWIRHEMSVLGLRLKYELLGKSVMQTVQEKSKKQIACTRSFEENYSELAQVSERVTAYASVCSEKLRRQNSNCNALMVFIHTNEHRQDHAQYSRNIVMPLPFPSNSALELNRYAQQALKRIFKAGYQYKKAGVIAMDLTPAEAGQMRLFGDSDPRHKPLMLAVDHLNRQHGMQKVRLAAQTPGRVWKMKQAFRSPHYTTRFKDIINVHI